VPDLPAPPPLRISVRSRLLGVVVLMTTLGLAGAGIATFALQWERVDQGITDSLEQEVAEFRRLAQDGVDPVTGEPFQDAESLLRVALQQNVPDRNETLLTVLDGAPFQFDGGDRPIALEDEPAVLEAVAAVQGGGTIAVQELPTAAGPARVAIIPVAGPAGPPGAYLIAYALERERQEVGRQARTYALLSGGALLLVGGVGWLVAGRLLRPLTELRLAAARIHEADLSERIPVRGADDITDLTVSYNDMLDRIEEAFGTQRQFLDDAGHELRTPLTILRGHLELMDPQDPNDVGSSRELLLDEVDRMSRMVEELILLSKARRPDFLHPAPVQLSALVDTVLRKAGSLGERRWRVGETTDAVVLADAQRLTEAMLELASNAVKHSDQGTEVVIGARVLADRAELWLADQGRGIPAEDLEAVFERFRQGSERLGGDGSGLGLSIVAAIAEAHGGTVAVDSRPGAGSTFTISIPRHPVPAMLAGERADHPTEVP
jgi:signal transduction histidine kinase